MPQRFLSIKNFEKYQSSTDAKSKPWIKLWKSVLGDPEFMKLSTHHRFLYTGLLLLADDCGNKIYNCPTYIGQRLYIPPTQVDLRPLYRAGFLTTSNLTRTLQDSSKEDPQRGELEGVAPPPTLKPRLVKSLTEWPEGFQFTEKHQAYAEGLGLNVHNEFVNFKNKAQAKGWTNKDWGAAFRNWMDKAVEFKQPRRG